MALIKCHECGKEVSTDAKNCPSCGAVVKTPKKKSRLGKLVMYAFIGAVAVGVLSKALNNDQPSKQLTPEEEANKTKNETLSVLAKQCTSAIVSSLKVREDANIPNPYSASDYDKFYRNENNGIYTVQVTFEARNSFNALKKSIVECKWKKVGEDFKSLGMKSIE